MSKGRIVKPSKVNLPSQLSRQPLEEIIYTVIQSCEVDTDDAIWKEAFEELTKKMKVDSEEQRIRLESVLGKLDAIEKSLAENPFDVSKLVNDLQEEVKALKRKRTANSTEKKTTSELKHEKFSILLSILKNQLNVYLVGPAGAGKTFVAEQCARVLNVPFHFTGAVASEFKLTGFIDAQGRVVSTEFRKAYEFGGLFLFDEIDGSYPQAVLAFNAALANDYMDFPDRRVLRHKDFYCIAAANTFGQGADRQYVGRNQLDAASLDRFVFLEWNYDEKLEIKLASNSSWTTHVQAIRKFVHENKIRHVVSPRASIFGSILLSSGVGKSDVEDLVVWKGMDEATKTKIQEGIRPRETVVADKEGSFKSKVQLRSKVKKGDVIAVITFRKDYRDYDFEVISPCSGTVIKIHEERSIEKGDIVALVRK